MLGQQLLRPLVPLIAGPAQLPWLKAPVVLADRQPSQRPQKVVQLAEEPASLGGIP